MDLQTVKKNLVQFYADEEAKAVRVAAAEAAKKARDAAVDAKATELVEVLNVALAVGKGKPVPSTLFAHIFGATMDICEKRGIKVTNRSALANNQEGFELISALVDKQNTEHEVAIEAATQSIVVASYKRPEPVAPISYDLPAGAEDLTNTIDNGSSAKGASK